MNNKVKILSNELGLCPYCNSDDIDIGAARYEADFISFPCSCNNCKRYFEEYNELTFLGLYVGRSGEYDADEYLGEEINYEE